MSKVSKTPSKSPWARLKDLQDVPKTAKQGAGAAAGAVSQMPASLQKGTVSKATQAASRKMANAAETLVKNRVANGTAATLNLPADVSRFATTIEPGKVAPESEESQQTRVETQESTKNAQKAEEAQAAKDVQTVADHPLKGGSPTASASDSIMRDPSPENVARQEKELSALGLDPGNLLKAVARKARAHRSAKPGEGTTKEQSEAGRELSNEIDAANKDGRLSKLEGKMINRRTGASNEALDREDTQMRGPYRTLAKKSQLKDALDYLKVVGGDSTTRRLSEQAIRESEQRGGLEEQIADGDVGEAKEKAKKIEGVIPKHLGDDPGEALINQDKEHWETFDTLRDIVGLFPGPYNLPALLMDAVKDGVKHDRGEMSNSEWWTKRATGAITKALGPLLSKLTDKIDGPGRVIAEGIKDGLVAGGKDFAEQAAKIWAGPGTPEEKMKMVNAASRRAMAKAAEGIIKGQVGKLAKLPEGPAKQKLLEVMKGLAEKYGVDPEVKKVLDGISETGAS